MGLPPLIKGVQLVAGVLAACDPKVYKRDDDDSRERYREHPAERLLNRRPYGNLPPFVFRNWLWQTAILHGNAYGYIQRVNGEPFALIPVHPSQVEPAWVYGLGPSVQVGYFVKSADPSSTAEPVYVDGSDMLHFRNLITTDYGYFGKGVIDLAKEFLGQAIATQKFASLYFKNNGSLGAVTIELPQADGMKTAQVEDYTKAVKRAYGNLDKAHDVMVLAHGAKMNRSPVNAEETQLVGLRELNDIAVGQLLGLNANKINSKIGSGYNSNIEMNAALFSDLFNLHLVNGEHEMNLKLLRLDEYEGGGAYLEFDRQTLLEGNPIQAREGIVFLVEHNMMSVEAGRKKLNLPEDDGGTYMMSNGTQIVGQEPEPAPELPESLSPGTMPTEEKQPENEVEEEDDNEAVRGIVQASLGRLIERVRKQEPATRSELVTRNRRVFAEALPGKGDWVERFLSDLGEEIEASLPEQRSAVFDRLDIEKLTEELWKA